MDLSCCVAQNSDTLSCSSVNSRGIQHCALSLSINFFQRRGICIVAASGSVSVNSRVINGSLWDCGSCTRSVLDDGVICFSKTRTSPHWETGPWYSACLPVRAPQPSGPSQVLKMKSSCADLVWLRTVHCWSHWREGCSTQREHCRVPYSDRGVNGTNVAIANTCSAVLGKCFTCVQRKEYSEAENVLKTLRL